VGHREEGVGCVEEGAGRKEKDVKGKGRAV
jgi:hypothetical protein